LVRGLLEEPSMTEQSTTEKHAEAGEPGEGNVAAAERHRERVKDYKNSHDVDAAAEKARKAREDKTEELDEAERVGKAPAKR